MKNNKITRLLRAFVLVVSLIALMFAPTPRAFGQNTAPVTSAPLSGDILTSYRIGSYGNDLRASYALWQLESIFPPVAGPGIQVAPFGTNSGQFIVSLNLINSPTQAMGYYTGVGAGQTVNQSVSKSTAVVMPNPCFTGTIKTSSASLANGATVKFTVTDPAVAASDVVVVNAQQGSITATAAYFFSANADNGDFVVNITNNGTTNSDNIILNFIVLRASGN